MKKFECNDCRLRKCTVEEFYKGVIEKPELCPYQGGYAEWKEVIEEPKEEEKEMKTIRCINLDMYGNLTTTSTTTFVENIETILIEEDWDYENNCSVQRIVVTYQKFENQRFVYLGEFEERSKKNNGYLDVASARYLYTELLEEIKKHHENYAIIRKGLIKRLGFEKENIINDIIQSVAEEYEKACKKHPNFPDNPFEQFSIIHEELGEATQALNNLKHHKKGTIDDVQIELVHTIVTCIRALKEMEK